MTTSAIKVCPSTQLVDGGLAFKLPVQLAGEATTAFFVRYKGNVYGYLNRCPHMGSQLDWEGHVFTRAGDQLMCARHGATFSPDTGECTGGPCQPSRLSAQKVPETEQTVLWRQEKHRVGKEGG